MSQLIAAFGAYTVYLLWFPLLFPDTYFPFLLSWAGAGALMSIVAPAGSAWPLIVLSLLSLGGCLAFAYQPLPFWIIAIGALAGAAVPYFLEAARGMDRREKALGRGVASGAIVMMCLAYLWPHIPFEHLDSLISALPLFWLVLIPLRPWAAPEGREDLPYPGGIASMVLLFAIGLITGIYNGAIFEELSWMGWPHHLILFISLSLGALMMGHLIGKGGLRLHFGLSFVLAICLSLALFGYGTTPLTYGLSDLLVGFGLGGASLFSLSLMAPFSRVQKAACIGFTGLGLVVGSRMAALLQGFYGIDMEGIAFISISAFIASTVPPLFMIGMGRGPLSVGVKGSGGREVGGKAESPPPGEGARTSPEGSLLEVMEGATSLPEEERDSGMIARVERRRLEDFSRRFGLSQREGEVLDLLLKAKTTREIAEALFVSESTIKSHVKHIYEKAGVTKKIELIMKIQNP